MAAHWQAVRSGKSPSYQSTIAILIDHANINSWRGSYWGGEIVQAFDDRAHELGYLTEEFHVGDPDDGGRCQKLVHAAKIMAARGISAYAIIYCAHPRIFMECSQSFSEFTGVFIGAQFSLTRGASNVLAAHLPFHKVNPDRYGNMNLLLHRLHELGYRRPGYWPNHWMEAFNAGEGSAAFNFWIRNLPEHNRLPVLVKDWQLTISHTARKPQFLDWLDHAKPDVVICENFEVRDWITGHGLSVPRDIGLAHLGIGPLEAGWSGINPHQDHIAAAAADLVTARLQRNERGTPLFPWDTRIEGSWVDGDSTRPQ
jgi:LacI family transcriptional regulator